MNIGDLVHVVDWEGKVLERRVVNIGGKLVFVCTDQEFDLAKKMGREPIAVGWPIDAVKCRREKDERESGHRR